MTSVNNISPVEIKLDDQSVWCVEFDGVHKGFHCTFTVTASTRSDCWLSAQKELANSVKEHQGMLPEAIEFFAVKERKELSLVEDEDEGNVLGSRPDDIPDYLWNRST